MKCPFATRDCGTGLFDSYGFKEELESDVTNFPQIFFNFSSAGRALRRKLCV